MIRQNESRFSRLPESDPKLPPGTNRCRCASCGAYFGGLRAFEKHRIGPASDRTCLDPRCVSDRQNQSVLKLNRLGYWVLINRPVHLRHAIVQVAA